MDESALLPRCLHALVPQVRETADEVLLVDGGSQDKTREIARSFSEVRILDSCVGRAEQMNVGAVGSRGSLLWFLPADAVVPEGALQRLAEIDRRRSPQAGGFLQRFDHRRPALRLISFLHNLRCRFTGIVYGDQAPWVRRELFEAVGGFREGMALEDLEFGVRLRAVLESKPRLLPVEVVSSSRRFDRAGDLRATVEAARVLFWWTFFRRTVPSRTFFDSGRD